MNNVRPLTLSDGGEILFVFFAVLPVGSNLQKCSAFHLLQGRGEPWCGSQAHVLSHAPHSHPSLPHYFSFLLLS